MNKDLLKGCGHALIYYLSGSALALIAHLLFEDVYILERGNRLYHLILLITWLAGCLWGLYNAYKYFKGEQKHYNLGLLTIHLLVTLGIIIWVYMQQSPEEEMVYLIQ